MNYLCPRIRNIIKLYDKHEYVLASVFHLSSNTSPNIHKHNFSTSLRLQQDLNELKEKIINQVS